MKQKIYIAGVLLLLSAAAYSVPARRGWQTKMLEDGSTIVVRQSGDENYHYWESTDGKFVEKTDKGFKLTDRSVFSPEEAAIRRAAMSPNRAPQAIGEINFPPRGLVILASFQDVQFNASNDSAAMWEFLNKSGYDYNGATGSAADYFRDQSNGQYTPVFDVIGPIVLPQNRKYYGENTATGSDGRKKDSDAKVRQMIKDACSAVDDKVDFTQYASDPNHPNRIDFVYVIYAGIGENDENSVDDAVWACRGAYLNMTLDGKTLNDYACSGETDGITGKRNGIGTFCHEFGHVLGFPDYYDTAYKDNYDYWRTPNSWSTMDVGSYNNGGNTPPNYSLFDKYYLGWATPKVLSKNAQINVTLGTAYEDGYMITKSGAAASYSTTDTVYYIENRQKSGWDRGLPGHGMLVWRVVYDASNWKSNIPNNTAGAPRYTVVSAVPGKMIGCNGCIEEDKQGNCTYAEYSDYNPFPGSGNVTSYTPWAGYAMTEIKEADGKILFKLNGGPKVTLTLDVNETEAGTVQGGGSYEWLSNVEFSAKPNYGYHFDQWNDGEKSNPRTITVTQDSIFTAIFAVDATGKCGKDDALTWTYDAETKTLTISGNGSLDEQMHYGVEAQKHMTTLIIDEGVTALGDEAFSNCPALAYAELPASVSTIGERAFYNCPKLMTIYNYRDNPCSFHSTAFEQVNTSDCILYVLSGSVSLYKQESSPWKIFDHIEPMGGTTGDFPVSDMEMQSCEHMKIIKDGQLYLMYKGQMYNVQGKAIVN